MDAGPSPRLLLMGRIGAAHGIRGEVRLQSFTEDPLAIAGYGPLATSRPGLTLSMTAARIGPDQMLIARFDGIIDRNAAEALNGLELFLDRASLPEPDDPDDYYHADLIGLEARLSEGIVLGKVSALPNFGAGDLIEITDPRSGDTFLYPFTKRVVPDIRLKDGYLVIEPPLDAEPGEEEPD